ncbi:MAG: hypothetical protein HS116_21235 [Planctomycetes bacterium]|nr:hypothetical protein [Planctomycetota bacterium]
MIYKHFRCGDRMVTAAQYVKAWRMVKAAPPGSMFRKGLAAWWPQSREEILRDFAHYANDIINIRGGLPCSREVKLKPRHERRLQSIREAAGSECRSCGSNMPYQPHHARFCDLSCRRSYMS